MSLLYILISHAVAATSLGPVPFPVFLKEGFSSVLEFEEAPTQVVLGDQNQFQVERLNKSIVIKPLASDAATNMFVYFKTKETRLFLLKASEDAEPTFYKKFESFVSPPVKAGATKSAQRKPPPLGIHISKAAFDKKKDYLTVDFLIAADSSGKIIPSWDQVKLKYKERQLSPSKLWSERREVQSSSAIKARLIFTKPDIPKDFSAVSLVIPLKDSKRTLSAQLKGGGN